MRTTRFKFALVALLASALVGAAGKNQVTLNLDPDAGPSPEFGGFICHPPFRPDYFLLHPILRRRRGFESGPDRGDLLRRPGDHLEPPARDRRQRRKPERDERVPAPAREREAGIVLPHQPQPMARRPALPANFDDDGATWSEPKRVFDAPGNFVLNNDRVIQTTKGRLIVPVAFHRSRGTKDASQFIRLAGHCALVSLG